MAKCQNCHPASCRGAVRVGKAGKSGSNPHSREGRQGPASGAATPIHCRPSRPLRRRGALPANCRGAAQPCNRGLAPAAGRRAVSATGPPARCRSMSVLRAPAAQRRHDRLQNTRSRNRCPTRPPAWFGAAVGRGKMPDRAAACQSFIRPSCRAAVPWLAADIHKRARAAVSTLINTPDSAVTVAIVRPCSGTHGPTRQAPVLCTRPVTGRPSMRPVPHGGGGGEARRRLHLHPQALCRQRI